MRRPSRIQSKRISKHAEPLGAEERLRPDDDGVERRCPHVLLAGDLRLAVRPDAVQREVLGERVHLRDAVDGCRGDVDEPADAGLPGGVEQLRRPVDVHGHDLAARAADRQAPPPHARRRRRRSRAARAFASSRMSPRISTMSLLDRIVDGDEVERAHLVALGDEVAREVQAEKARTAGDGVDGYRETVTACAGRGAGCGGGFESTRTAAASSTAMPIVASPTQAARELRHERVAAIDERPRDHVMQPSPRERDRHERELDEQHVPVALRPQVGDVRQPQDAQVDPGRDERGDQHRREPRDSGGTPRAVARARAARRRARAARGRRATGTPPRGEPSRRAPTSTTLPRRQPSAPRARGRKRSRARARTRARAGRAARAARRGRRAPRRARSRASSRRRPSRTAPARDRRQVAVEEVPEGQLQRILGTQQERGDARPRGRRPHRGRRA